MGGESSEELERFDPPKYESAPWLVFIPNHEYNKRSKKSKRVSSQTFYSISEKKSYIKNIDGTRGYNWWSTPQGWIFMQEPKSKKCCLWNPIKSVKISVSSYKWNFSSDANCVISSSPLEPAARSCRVMCLDDGGSMLFVYDLETNKWERHDIKGRPLTEIFVLNGQFYCSTYSCKIAVIDLIPNLQVRVVDDGFPRHDAFTRVFTSYEYYLVSSGGIFGVEICFGAAESKKAIHVVVYQKDHSDGTWNIVDQIGNNAFFLGPSQFGASCPADGINIKSDCIYFLYDGDCCMYVFDMIEGTIQVDAPCPEFLYRATSTSLQWIIPPK